MRDDTAIDAVSRQQDDLITRDQVLACHGTDEWIEAQIAARRWLRVMRKVYKTTTGDMTRRQRERAALLCAGPSAALSHRTAAARFGLVGVRDDEPVHITVPYGKSADIHPGVVIHRSRAFEHLVIDREDLPTVSAADTAVDIAVLEPDARAGMKRLLHLALAMNVSTDKLLFVLEVRPPRRYRTALRDAVTMLAQGVASVLEAKYATDVEDAHGLPRGERQHPVAVGGRIRWEDCRYRLPRGDLLVRLDGWRWHSDRHVGVIDRARDNAAELAGRARLTFGYEEIFGDTCEVYAVVSTRAYSLGWEGPTGPVLCTCAAAA